MRSNAPGLCVLGVAAALFGTLVVAAWCQDAALDLPLPPTNSEHICDRLSYELAQQVNAHMISRRQRYDLVTRCLKLYK